MTKTEEFLKERWYVEKCIKRLLLDLSLAKSACEEAYSNCGLSCGGHEIKTQRQRSSLSPVEYSAILVADQYSAEMESIERRLESERARAMIIDRAVKTAGLTQREEDYVRLRYFDNRTVEATAQRLFCSPATCGRLRESALSKLDYVLGGEKCQEA